MNIRLVDDWLRDQPFQSRDPGLPGDWRWCRWIPSVHRALVSQNEAVSLPRFRPDFELMEACAYWEPAVYLMVRLLGWPLESLGTALRWWLRRGCASFDDPRLQLLRAVWAEQGQLGLLALWAWQHEGRAIEDFEGPTFAEAARRDFEGRVKHSPLWGGSNPLHLGHSIVEEDDAEAMLMTPRPAHLRAALVLDRMNGWPGALRRLGGMLPPAAPSHWKIEVFVRPVGLLGTFRRSDVTGRWFQGKHSVHAGWLDEKT